MIESQKTDANSRPYAEVKVLNCGELVPKSKGDIAYFLFLCLRWFMHILLLASSYTRSTSCVISFLNMLACNS